jgi:hypothetical protein
MHIKIYISKIIKLKLLKTNVAIWFNKMCRTKQITPTYISIKVSGNNIHSRRIATAATKHGMCICWYKINNKL